MIWAMAFAEWTCREDGCGQSVRWVDAAFELDDDGRLVGVRHESCVSGVGGNQE